MLWILSGLGGDHRLYHRIRVPDQHRHVAWRHFAGCQHMTQFADRLLALGVAADDRIMASSFGGFVALELSQRIRLGGLLLLGSAIQQREICRLALRGGDWARSFSGSDMQYLMQPLARLGPKALELRMFIDSDVQIMSGMLCAIQAWRGTQPGCRWRRIHGRLDPVIPWRSNRAYHASPWCSHLVALERPDICQDSLEWLLR